MDNKKMDFFPKRFPSPEELFRMDIEEQEEQKQVQKQIEMHEQKQDEPVHEQVHEQKQDEPVHEQVHGQKQDVQVYEQQYEQAQEQKPAVLQENPAKSIAPQPKKKSASKHSILKFFSAGFVILVLALALLITNLDKFHVHYYCMMSESMEDLIPKGSIVFVHETPVKELEIGDVITYTNKDGVSITHQIISVLDNYKSSGQPAFQTKGTSNTAADDEIVTEDMIQGKVKFYIPYIGKPFIK